MTKTILQKNIELLMKHKGFNMKSLSLEAGLNETAIRDILKRVSKPSYQTIDKISHVLGYSSAQLINDDLSIESGGESSILDLESFSIAIEKIDKLIEKHNLNLNSKTKAKVYLACYKLVKLNHDEQDFDFDQVFNILQIKNS